METQAFCFLIRNINNAYYEEEMATSSRLTTLKGLRGKLKMAIVGKINGHLIVSVRGIEYMLSKEETELFEKGELNLREFFNLD